MKNLTMIVVILAAVCFAGVENGLFLTPDEEPASASVSAGELQPVRLDLCR